MGTTGTEVWGTGGTGMEAGGCLGILDTAGLGRLGVLRLEMEGAGMEGTGDSEGTGDNDRVFREGLGTLGYRDGHTGIDDACGSGGMG